MFCGGFVGPATKPAEAGGKTPIPSAPVLLRAGLGRHQPRKPLLLSSVLPPFLCFASQCSQLGGNLLFFIALGKRRRQLQSAPLYFRINVGTGAFSPQIPAIFLFNKWRTTAVRGPLFLIFLSPHLCLSLLPAKQETKESLPFCLFFTHLLLRLPNKMISVMFFVRSAGTLHHKRVILLYGGKILIFLLCVFNGDNDYDLPFPWCLSSQRTSACFINPQSHTNSTQGWLSLLLKHGHLHDECSSDAKH